MAKRNDLRDKKNDPLRALREDAQAAIRALPEGQAQWKVCSKCRRRDCVGFHTTPGGEVEQYAFVLEEAD